MKMRNLRRLAPMAAAVVCMGVTAAPASAQEGGCSAVADPPITNGTSIIGTGHAHCASADLSYTATLKVCVQRFDSYAIPTFFAYGDLNCQSVTRTIGSSGGQIVAAAQYLCPPGVTHDLFRTRAFVVSPGFDIQSESAPVYLACTGGV